MGHLQISSCSSSKDFGFSDSKFLSNNNDLNLFLRVFLSGCETFSKFREVCLKLIFFERDSYGETRAFWCVLWSANQKHETGGTFPLQPKLVYSEFKNIVIVIFQDCILEGFYRGQSGQLARDIPFYAIMGYICFFGFYENYQHVKAVIGIPS